MNNRERLKQNNSKLKILSSESKKLPTAINTTDADATSEDIAAGKTAYVNDEKVTGTLIVNNLQFGLQFDNRNGSRINSALLNVDKLDTSNITDFNKMFIHCGNLTNVPKLDTSNATDTSYMFYNCSSLTEIPLIDTSNVTNMNYMFYNCSSLTEIPLIDTSNVTNMGSMLGNCRELVSIPSINTSNATSMYGMFSGCNKLINAPLLDTHNVVNMSDMFRHCRELRYVPEYNTSSIVNMENMFYSNSYYTWSTEVYTNVLNMCINAVNIAEANRTLKYIGFTEARADMCTLSNRWQAFLDAGWTTGY